MPLNQFNIGKDVTLSIIGPAGALNTLGLLREFEARQKTTTLQSLPINNEGIPVHRNTYQGWEGHLMFDRQGGTADALANLLETNFYGGNPEIFFEITEVVRNGDGSTNRYTYLDVVIHMDSGGRFAQNEIVSQRLNWSASQRTEG